MPPVALALLLLAAALHAAWNLLLKRSGDKQIFAWWVLAVGSVLFAPVLLISGALPQAVWPLLVASAAVEALYFVALTLAYQYGDFSLVYPLARGGAPALLALWVVLFEGDLPDLAGWTGLALLIAGLIVVGGAEFWRRHESVHRAGVLLALATALCISVYTAIDGVAVHMASPMTYVVILLAATAALTAPAVVWRFGQVALLREWQAHWRRILLGGVLSMLAYALVLQAYTISRLAYAGAVREVSVVLAALVGWRYLGESFGASRTIGAVLIFAGILIIAVVG